MTSKNRTKLESSFVFSVILACFTSSDDDMLNPVHEHVRAGIHARGNKVIQHVLKAFMLSHDCVERVSVVNVWGLEDRINHGYPSYEK